MQDIKITRMDSIKPGDLVIAPIGEKMSPNGEVVDLIVLDPLPEAPTRHRITFLRTSDRQLDEDLVHYASDGYPIVVRRR